MCLGGDHKSTVRSDLVTDCDSDQRSERNKEQPDVRRKNWSEPCAPSMCVHVCVCLCMRGGGVGT